MKKIYSMLALLLFCSINSFAQDPCANITTISCGNNITFTQTGTGDVNYPLNFGGCSGSTAQGGKEQIYQFTPTVTGTYEIETSTATGGVVQYLWKQQSLGCSNTGWNCIDRTNNVGSVGAVNFTAGTTYYIILNAEPTTSVTQVFKIKCARVVCQETLPITCGVDTNFSSLGYGDPNYALNFGSCSGSTAQGGKEQIYQFTPTVTGTYEIETSTATGGVVQYLWKQQSLGCSNTGWNCIDRTNNVGSVGAVNFTAGTTYYIILNAEPTTSVTHVFKIKCARVVCQETLPITCGVDTNFSSLGYGDPNYALNFGSCSGSTAQGGKEQIYQFTPTVTGTYEIETSTATGGVVQYLWKQQSLGCSNTGWNCIDRTNNVGSVGAVNFTAGTTYYIILNAEPTTSVTHVFKIKCARVVCQETLPITCGVDTNFSSLGYGDPNYALNFGSCSGSTAQGGKEQIYQFTPTVTGTYEIETSTATGGVVQYLWKQQSLGCSNTAWNCIDRTNNVGSVGAINFTAGTTYYIILNAEPTTSVTHVFKIKCARVVCQEILPITCGVDTNFSVIGFGDPNYALNFSSCSGSTAQGGKEQIYLLPASSTNYQINISTALGGVVQYAWKLASLPCNNSNWNCLERINNQGTVLNTNSIPTNTAVYLMLNAEPTSAITHVFNVNCNPLAINDFENINEISLYPNPANSILNIKLFSDIIIDKVVITDLTGKVIKEEIQNNSQINVENLSSGVYFIQVYSGTNKFQNKFIKE